ncbi:MAG TPA: branched-chain amino acid ABC transporter permease [Candidatus Enterocloster excrementigallinarum]|uniref:Branched-chain amino acid ABC transporter permease n=1 Tax=Candidatus Enterocloster excrementigallinarum TaxID=2838558 RepID=A0A9D2PUN8_9FIRM|nr:branched-chain amino acid ABC transporter permease [Candidatus Enterocloster excrementigallinarum]
MELFLSLTLSGVSLGMVYALQAIGLILLLRAVGVMNFAQGDLLAIGAYALYFITVMHDIQGPIAIVLLLLFFVAFGAFFMMTTYWPVRKTKWEQALLVVTIGASTVIKELEMLICGSQPQTIEPIVRGSIQMGRFVLQYQYLFVFAIAGVLMVAVYVLFDKLYAGRAMSAAAQNKYAAELIGIPTKLTTLSTYAIVATICGVCGALCAPLFMVRTSLATFQMKSFAGIVLGGFGNIKGAIVGSLIIGLIEAYSTYVTTIYKDVAVFGALLLVLIFRPQGLFKGVTYQEKA